MDLRQGLIMPPSGTKCAQATRSPRPNPSSFPANLAFVADHSCVGRLARFAALVCAGIVLLVTLGAQFAVAETVPSTTPNWLTITDPFAAYIAEASHRFGIPPSSIRAVIGAESSGDARAVSRKGAMGLMQVMPETWASLRFRYGLGADPFDPHDNILAGAAYLRELHDRYGALGFLAAYNAGPARYEAHLATGEPLPDETLAYVGMLAPVTGGDAADAHNVVAAALSWTEAPLFVVQADRSQTASRLSSAVQPERSSAAAAVNDLTGLVSQSTGLFVAVSLRNVLR
jgi:soluble lytic murein transglycosylase-like protein